MYETVDVDTAKERAFQCLGKTKYSQSRRNPSNFDAVPAFLDCSSFMGWVWRIPNPYLITDSMPGYLKDLGFRKLPYYPGTPLEDGDILVTPTKGHTGMYIQEPFPGGNITGFNFIHCTSSSGPEGIEPGVTLADMGYVSNRGFGIILRSDNGGIRITDWDPFPYDQSGVPEWHT